MELSNEQKTIIAAHPLNLDHERGILRDPDDMPVAVAKLLHALAISKAIPKLHSGSCKLLSTMGHNLVLGPPELELFEPLVEAVVSGSPDTAICAAVLDILEVRLRDESLARRIKLRLFSEIKHSVYRRVLGFWEKYFDIDSWQQQRKDMYTRMHSEHGNNGWGFPEHPDKRSVREWLKKLESRYSPRCPNKLCNTTGRSQATIPGQMDVYFGTGHPGSEFDVLLAGELKHTSYSNEFEENTLQLARLVRGIFSEQPTRRFVHGFLLCGSVMELWVFDRSGLYSSGEFDIISYPDKFASAFIGYATMDDTALGRDVFIRDSRLTLYDSTTRGETTISLDTKPFFRQNAIVCRGTTCYQTDDDNKYVAKFAWAPEKRQSELDLLKHAREKNVQGVVKVVASRRITSIEEQRAGLQFRERHCFNKTQAEEHPSQGLPVSNALGRKRKFSKGSSTSSNKRRRSGPGQPDPTQYQTSLEKIEEKVEIPLGDQAPPSFEPLPIQQKESPISVGTLSSVELPTEGSSRADTTNKEWENRIYSCVVISPAGRVISEFETVKELLESMRDAIRAHRSLLLDGRILHRDISANNIIITNPNTADGFKGMLIDLDLAKLLDEGPTGAHQQTGTMQYMAIQVLKDEPGHTHTYRHDLESFLYVLLWMCARTSWTKTAFTRGKKKKPSNVSELDGWITGKLKDIAKLKEFHMFAHNFIPILEEFPEGLEDVKPLCQIFRLCLFEFNDFGYMSHRAPEDPNELYNPILKAFDDTINKLQ